MAFLTLSNGDTYEGRRIGAPVDRIGELVFSTGMAGYLETLTDPSYYGQIVTQSFPLIGNYGVIPEDFEGTPRLFGYIVRDLCDTPSNFRSEGKLNDFLLAHGIPGLCGADTREIVRTVREEGVMNAMISDIPPADLFALRAYWVENAVATVTCLEKQIFPVEGNQRFRISLMDYGVKRGIVRSLQKRGCEVTIWPAGTKAENVLANDPDGIVLSNGPGDPKENDSCIAEIRKMLGAKPMMGICLGHQLIALALGGDTVKLKYGHRGGNQPVKDLTTGQSFITSQNHGYAVVACSLRGIGQEVFVNVNDGSCEGMAYPDLSCFSVQFHPEACAGPRDTDFLFDRLIRMMGGKEHA